MHALLQSKMVLQESLSDIVGSFDSIVEPLINEVFVLVCVGVCWCVLVCVGVWWCVLVCGGVCWCVVVCALCVFMRWVRLVGGGSG